MAGLNAVKFVDFHRSALIQRVSFVMPIADVLLQESMINTEAYNKICTTKTSQGQMRLLYEALVSGGPAVKETFYVILQEQHPHLVEDLTVKFVNDHRDALIERVPLVRPIVRVLCQKGIIDENTYSNIDSAESTQDQMSLLYEALTSRTPEEKATFYAVLQEQHPRLVAELNQESCKVVGRIIYNEEDVLGEGTTSTVVYRGTYEKGPKDMVPVAVKKIATKKLAERELQMLRECDKQPIQHANIIRWFGTEEEGGFFYIALEKCDTSLNEFLSSVDEYRDRQTVRDLLHQIMSGLAHLHSLGIVHRDVKPENIMLRMSDNGEKTVKILDFGISKKLDQKKTTTLKGFGTMCWMAPENDASDDLSLDIFSAGCLFHYVWAKAHPFGDMSDPRLVMANIIFGLYSLNLKEDNHDDIVARDLIEQMLSMEPQKRPSAETILQHPFLWSSQKILAFFEDVSDWTVKKQMDENEKGILGNLESEAQGVVKEGGWMEHLEHEALKRYAQDRKHKGHKIESLLRMIRNLKHHYNEVSLEVRTSLGSIPDGFVSLFTSCFPRLLLHTYLAMRDCQDPTIQAYYTPSRTHLIGHGSRE